MTIKKFYDTNRLLDIRELSLNPVIDKVNELDPKVKGLQDVVALTLTQPSVNVADKKITFKKGDTGITQEVDLGPMFEDYKHGIDISGDNGVPITNVEKVKFKNSTLTKNGDEVTVDFKPIEGQVASGSTLPIKHLRVTGNTNGSSLGPDGIMILNMPRNSIDAKVNGNSFTKVDKISVVDNKSGSSVEGDTIVIRVPDTIEGTLQGGTSQVIKSLSFNGNVGTSSSVDGHFVIDLPMQEVDPGDGYEVYHKIKLTGNVGSSKVENQELTLDLPFGGGGTGTAELKVGEENKNPIPNVGEIYFKDSDVKIHTTKSGNKVLVSSKGFPVGKDDDPTQMVKQIKLTGDVETSVISSSGLLTLNIPHHAGLSVSDGGSLVSKGITTLEFKDSKVEVDSSSGAKAIITPKSLVGKLETGVDIEPITEVLVKGTLGSSTLSNGKLTIDLPAGGGGGGTTDPMTGVVGSEAATINRIEVIGTPYNSSVNTGTKTLKVDIPRKVAIKGGSDVFSDIDTVEVANSTVQLDESGGQRKAFITPHIPYMFFGWFGSRDELESAIPVGGRIPTKTCAYVLDPVTKQHTLMMWMPNTLGNMQWTEMPVTGSLGLWDGNHKVHQIQGFRKNSMVEVDPDGLAHIKDTTVPDVLYDIESEDGTAVVKTGIFNKLKIEDGVGVVDFDLTDKSLTLHRPQRRLAMGDNPVDTRPYLANTEYEGSIFFNQTDAAWWGYHDIGGDLDKKWTKVLHNGMSEQVSSLDIRLPKQVEIVVLNTADADAQEWQVSGWTYIAKESQVIPTELRGRSGGYVQTFVHEEGSGEKHRTQIMYMDIDAIVFKRNLEHGSTKWPAWSQVSFNKAELQAHNDDPGAHRKTHPFYKTVTFDCKYKELKSGNRMLPINSIHTLGSSDGKHKISDDKIATIPYKGTYRVRGRLYFSGIPESAKETDFGNWFLTLKKRPKGGIWSDVKKVEYDHNTTSMIYPPLMWDIENIPLELGDDLQLEIRFQPKPGTTEEAWLLKHPEIGFYGLRSFVAVDEHDNDGGYALGETHRKLHGKFASVNKAGVRALQDKPNDTVRVVGEEVANNFTKML